MLGCKHVRTPMDADADLWDEFGPLLEDSSQYRRLVSKLTYIIVMRHEVPYVVGLLSQFMYKPWEVHWKKALRILTYIKRSLGKDMLYKKHKYLQIEAFSLSSYARDKRDRKSTSGYCTYIGGNLVTWRSKKADCCVSFQCRGWV